MEMDLLTTTSEVKHAQRHVWTEKRYYRLWFSVILVLSYFSFYAVFVFGTTHRVWYKMTPAWPNITIDVDGCDVWLPGSDFYKHDYMAEYFRMSRRAEHP